MPHKILPIFEFDELVELFEYKNRKTAQYAVRQGNFPVFTFMLAGRRVAHVAAVDLYFDRMKAEVAEQKASSWDR